MQHTLAEISQADLWGVSSIVAYSRTKKGSRKSPILLAWKRPRKERTKPKPWENGTIKTVGQGCATAECINKLLVSPATRNRYNGRCHKEGAIIMDCLNPTSLHIYVFKSQFHPNIQYRFNKEIIFRCTSTF